MSVTAVSWGTSSRWSARRRHVHSTRRREFLARGLFLAKAIQPDDFGALARLRRLFLVFGGRGGNRQGGGRGDCRKAWRRCLSGGIGRLELQAELHRRVEEALDGIERNHQTLGNAAERQADLETILRYHQIPELVLKNDRHFHRILRQQPRRKPHALRGGQKRDEEMMFPGQAVLGGVGQYTAQHPSQRVARQHI